MEYKEMRLLYSACITEQLLYFCSFFIHFFSERIYITSCYVITVIIYCIVVGITINILSRGTVLTTRDYAIISMYVICIVFMLCTYVFITTSRLWELAKQIAYNYVRVYDEKEMYT